MQARMHKYKQVSPLSLIFLFVPLLFSILPTQLQPTMHTIKNNNSTMFRPDHSAPLFHQSFQAEDNSPLTSISTHLCSESGKRFVNWDDITIAFESIFYLQDRSEERLLFMIDEKAEL